MALPDPIPTITVNSVAYNFARTGTDAKNNIFSSVYQTPDKLDKLTISRQERARTRHTVRFDRRKIAADPFNAAINQEYSMSAYTVIDIPKFGFSNTEVTWLSRLASDFMVAGTPDYELRVIQGET
jgi:hypothetical protein